MGEIRFDALRCEIFPNKWNVYISSGKFEIEHLKSFYFLTLIFHFEREKKFILNGWNSIGIPLSGHSNSAKSARERWFITQYIRTKSLILCWHWNWKSEYKLQLSSDELIVCDWIFFFHSDFQSDSRKNNNETISNIAN